MSPEGYKSNSEMPVFEHFPMKPEMEEEEEGNRRAGQQHGVEGREENPYVDQVLTDIGLLLQKNTIWPAKEQTTKVDLELWSTPFKVVTSK